MTSENIIIAESFTNKQEKIVNSSMEDINLKINENDSSNMEGNGTKEKHSTPTQQCK